MKKLLFILVTITVLASCAEEQDPFEWNKDRIGMLTKDAMVYQIDSLFAMDSIVNPVQDDEYANGPNVIEIYEKGGKHLLSLTPYESDSTSTIENIRVRDNRYVTAEGISIDSDFKTISDTYKVSSIDNMINSAVIWVDEQNFYFTIDKEELPAEVTYDVSATIEKTMIPDTAKPEYVFISW
ncbi:MULTISPECIES: hypothetical protein [Nonlabens]|uniref:Uncharacterized protein n=1 Tax=Nonlabens agnitus TaxID=870484 RepID=A0A2S9WUS5_9FLAO|nr:MULTISPECIES: hypothetical protein [Nonlabens]KQC34381.1 hypothetical protein AAU57_14310 [Nonlabens sp. YIK11]PRP67225.1 hypothetical protein BST86_08990 [Nonlabens agnitus]